ncbi:MAG: hydroxymethylbilane synthase [Caldilinea sp.]|nr:hydroxymethylbilane synthase [Caldilinea sp.]MDW8441635.1 hydroxymethylbilane synthase [Caldilineaceae bacterium]
MSERIDTVRLGTRGSALARRQTDYVAELLAKTWPWLHIDVTVLHTQGDRMLDRPLPLIGGKGVFTAELEEALYSGAIDLAVHSLKDLPTEPAAELVIGAIPARGPVHDVVVSRSGRPLAQLEAGAAVGTSSRRRSAQLLRAYSHLRTVDIRGNVDTRIRKTLDPTGPYDAIVLAAAGVERLGRAEAVTEALPLEIMLPAPGQGALAVQCRSDAALLRLLAPLEDPDTRAAVTAERAFLRHLGGGCAVPVAAYAKIQRGRLYLRGRVLSPDGRRCVEVDDDSHRDDPEALGARLAARALAQGAAGLLAEVTP